MAVDPLLYKGPAWPVKRHLAQTSGSGSMWGLYDCSNVVREQLYEEFERKAAVIRNDSDRTDSGKQKALRALVEEFRAHKIVTALQGHIAAEQKREKELRAELLEKAAPHHAELSVYDQVSLAMSEARKIAAFEGLDSLERMKSIREADLRGDINFMALMLRENLIPEAIARTVEVALQKAGNRVVFGDLEELCGKVQPNGAVDVTTGALPVAQFSLGKFFEYLDLEAGISPAIGAAERTVKAATKGDTIRLHRDAVDASTYEIARSRAREINGTFIITSDEGDTVVTGPNNSGFDQTAPAASAGMQVAPNGSARDG